MVISLCEQFEVEVIAVGNNTAGRETETLVRGLDLPGTISMVMVSENGASVYSASEAAREEFPEQDVTVRGAVSIGRRLMDPLAELVKIDAKAIGVGQYQHDVDQRQLKEKLDDCVMSCVNLVRDERLRSHIDLKKYITGTAGLPTLTDIMAELAKPGRDPREQFEAFSFAEGVRTIEDVRPGMQLPGIITNITNFGAFVDIGVHQDGRVHISELADRFVKRPADVVKLYQKVTVTVLEVDATRRRITLSMKKKPQQRQNV